MPQFTEEYDMKKYVGVNTLSKQYAKKYGVTVKEADVIVRNFITLFQESLLDPEYDGVQFIDFLTLQRVQREAKVGRNVHTNTPMIIPEAVKLKVTLGKTFDNLLNS